jgi:hypothetical protein
MNTGRVFLFEAITILNLFVHRLYTLPADQNFVIALLIA